MSDKRLRELQRKWHETGSLEDEVAYLRERVRVGDLTPERLQLAAHCGYEPALLASAVGRGPAMVIPEWASEMSRELGVDVHVVWDRAKDSRRTYLEDLRDWVRGLLRFGPSVALRASISACRAAIAEQPNNGEAQRILDRLCTRTDPNSLAEIASQVRVFSGQSLSEEFHEDGAGGGWCTGSLHEVARALDLAAGSLSNPELLELVVIHATRSGVAPEALRARLEADLLCLAVSPSGDDPSLT